MDTEASPSGLVEVRFVGGPLHGRRVFMTNPEFHMHLEHPPGEPFVYCRRIVESSTVAGQRMQVVTYAPIGLGEHEFERLVLDAT